MWSQRPPQRGPRWGAQDAGAGTSRGEPSAGRGKWEPREDNPAPWSCAALPGWPWRLGPGCTHLVRVRV